MRISREQLKKIIFEEFKAVIEEGAYSRDDVRDTYGSEVEDRYERDRKDGMDDLIEEEEIYEIDALDENEEYLVEVGNTTIIPTACIIEIKKIGNCKFL